ncbi:Late embryogenesis abundant protein [Macleaya cordata]|uniref:Late embryogenesis abundant protein n=1 Tax=Macleaya cordata TaxID=56857 RepID=A0A200Q9Q3_MACCD|nr:Late embryogenesis abundant protein [Macleaya cordata]
MSDQTKQAHHDHLNGVYNGHAVIIPPPPQQSCYQSPPKRQCCVVNTLMIKVIVGFGIGFTIPLLIFYLSAGPTDVKFYVVAANLTQFDLNYNNNNNGNTLNYNLSLSMAVENPNKKIGIYYDMLGATASYKRERFSWASLPSFYQGHKNTTNLRLNFRGQSLIVLDQSDVSKFNSEKNTGVYYIDVKLYGRMRFKIGSIKTRRVEPEIQCNLRIPLASINGTLARAGRFESTMCDVYY